MRFSSIVLRAGCLLGCYALAAALMGALVLACHMQLLAANPWDGWIPRWWNISTGAWEGAFYFLLPGIFIFGRLDAEKAAPIHWWRLMLAATIPVSFLEMLATAQPLSVRLSFIAVLTLTHMTALPLYASIRRRMR